MNERLSSDILQEQFGPTSLEVILQSSDERIIQTVAEDKVLEVSYVQFTPASKQKFPETTKALERGASMGQAFRDAGIVFRRSTRFVSKIASSRLFSELFGGGEFVWVVGVDIAVGDAQYEYASIIEFYNPRVAWPEVPHELTKIQQQQVEISRNLLEAKLLR